MNTETQNKINIGIDTSKANLDIYARPVGLYKSFTNNNEGIKDAVRFIKQHKPTRVLIESTGRLEMDFVFAADKAGLPVTVCNPSQIRSFAKATGRFSKTDKLDA